MTDPRFSEVQIVLVFTMLTAAGIESGGLEISTPLAVFTGAYLAFLAIVMARISGRLYEPGRRITVVGKSLEALRAAKPAPVDIADEQVRIEREAL